MKKVIYFLLVTYIILLSSVDVEARVLYRYKDKNGVTVVKNSLPSEYAQKGYEILNERFQVIEVVPPKKSEEQIEQEIAKQKAEEAAKQAAIEAKKQAKLKAAENKKLMKQFHNVEDILRARKSEQGTVDVLISVNNGKIRQVNQGLAKAQSSAAKYERQGKALPQELQNNIAELQTEIDKLNKNNQQQEQRKKAIFNKFNDLLLRFNQLKTRQMIKQHEDQILDDMYPNARLIKCTNNCTALWQKSVNFFKQKSSLPLEFSDDKTLHSIYPKDSNTLGYALTLYEENQNRVILFNIFCQSSVAGKQLCQAPETRDVADQFVRQLQ